MTSKEVINRIYLHGKTMTQDEAMVIIGALEKQTPEKVTKKLRGLCNGDPVWDYFCPYCRRNLHNTPTFCKVCGQKIDWEE